MLLFPGAIYHQGRYKILSRVVYTTREGIDRFFRQISFYVKSLVFFLQIQVTRINDCSLELSKLISRNFDAINMRTLTVTY